jgi:hypothetical protein
VVLGAVAALLLVGCGSGGALLSAGGNALDVPAAPTPAYLAQAADRTVALETGRVEAQMTAPGVSATVTGAFDLTQRSAALTLVVDAEGETSTADVVVVDDALFVRPDGFGAALGEALGTPWVKVDLSDLTAMVPGTAELPAIEPAELIDRLRTEGIEVTEVGRESVRGVEATHYRAEVPAATGSAAVGAATIDVWIDDDGLVRRADLRGEDGVEARVELLDLGQPVSIEAPPSDQITDLGDLGGLLEKFTR